MSLLSVRAVSWGFSGLLALAGGLAHGASMSLAECSGIADDSKRLACFDRLAALAKHAGSSRQAATAAPAPAGPNLPRLPQVRDPAAPQILTGENTAPNPAPKREGPADFSLARHWEVGQEYKRGTFDFRPHRPNFIIANYSTSPNAAPYRPFQPMLPRSRGLSHVELAYQLGFKMKVAENFLNSRADLWVAYTQKSFWQAANDEASSPFRETNYVPEAMLVVPADFALLGMRARFVNFGFVHESNGQTTTLSRSWNRLYAQLGLERGNFSLLARTWKRLSEDAATDDNRNINDFLGYGDLLGTWRRDGHELSLLARRNFHTGHGALQAGWAFPLAGKVKGYLQLFSGYGQSLIDYDYAQKSIGLGVLVSY